jgi:serine/threonine protein kinase
MEDEDHDEGVEGVEGVEGIDVFSGFEDKQWILELACEAVKKNADRELKVSIKAKENALSRLYRVRVGVDFFVILKGRNKKKQEHLIGGEAEILKELQVKNESGKSCCGIVECFGTISVARERKEGDTDVPQVEKYLVMEYAAMTAVGLDQIEWSFDVKEKFTLLRTIALSLADIHRRGFVHLDLKPQNIFMVLGGKIEEGNVKPIVADFGLSINLKGKDSHPLGGTCGTWTYAAYEHANAIRDDKGRELKHPPQNFAGKFSDVFAFAAIVVGILLPSVKSKRECMKDVEARTPPYPEACLDVFPKDLDLKEIVQRSWDEDWKKRPTMDEWVENLKKHERSAAMNSAAYEFARGSESIVDKVHASIARH